MQPSLADVTANAYRAAEQLRAFKLSLLDRLLLGKVSIAFTPTFLNHMVNELMICYGSRTLLDMPQRSQRIWTLPR